MADLITSIIKSYLHERQIHEKGKLDGTLHFCKGLLEIGPKHKISKSIYPTYIIMEKHRGLNQRVFYKVFTNKVNDKYQLIKNKNDCSYHFFKEPIGAINLYYTVIQQQQLEGIERFTLVLEGSSIDNYVIKLDFLNDNFLMMQILLQNILEQYRYTDFEHHQYFNPII